MTDMTVVVA